MSGSSPNLIKLKKLGLNESEPVACIKILPRAIWDALSISVFQHQVL